MKVPGIPATHQQITPVCRANRGDLGAFDEAVRRLRAEYLRCLDGWAGRPVDFHVILTVEGKADPPEAPPVDRTQRTLTDGSPVTEDHRDLRPDGMQKAYVALSAEERAKGFVRPVRRSYRHTACGTITTMSPAIAETYARDPGFYGGTFCCDCRAHFPVAEFTWEGTDELVGS